MANFVPNGEFHRKSKKRSTTPRFRQLGSESENKVKFLEPQASPKIQCGSRFYLFSNRIGN
ncbi:hypothetical protein [Leptospira ellisii]|uniref:hypothetical protein n=1 Tax=Leptospira ellisii TaxID=2023197 RepID=UPI0013FD1A1E